MCSVYTDVVNGSVDGCGGGGSGGGESDCGGVNIVGGGGGGGGADESGGVILVEVVVVDVTMVVVLVDEGVEDVMARVKEIDGCGGGVEKRVHIRPWGKMI